MTNHEDVIRYIQTNKDKNELGEIIQVAREHLENLDRSLGVLRLVCRDNQWYALFPSDRRELHLGPRLTAATVLRRSRYAGPRFVEYELSEKEAKQQRGVDPGSVGRWEDDNDNKGYYDVSKYQKAKTEYVNWRKYAHDELALTLHMKVDAVKKVRLLESRGYELVIED